MAKAKDRSTRISVDPRKKGPKEEIEEFRSIFLDKSKLEKIAEEVSAKDQAMLPFVSDHVMRAVIHLAALGSPSPVIGRSLNIPVRRVTNILSSESVKREVERIQAQLYNQDAVQMFKRLVPAAVQTIFDIMVKKSHSPSSRLDAAKYLVDRAHGKPKEVIEQKTDIIAEVFASLQRKGPENATPIEAEFESAGDGSQDDRDPLGDLLGGPGH